MREKLRIARQFRISRRRTRNKECKRLYFKCYLAYVRQCIVGGKDDFEIIFKGKYLEPFKVRFEDWAIYWMEQIRRFYLMHFVSEKRLTGEIGCVFTIHFKNHLLLRLQIFLMKIFSIEFWRIMVSKLPMNTWITF